MRGWVIDFFARLFDTSDFPPRWTCGDWSPVHGWLHILSDLGIWSAYFAIPVVLARFIVGRRDLPFRKIFVLFGAFILLCGCTHLMDAIIFWWPAYRLSGAVKVVTAVVSWITVLALIQVAPVVLAMRSPEELEREIAARKLAEDRLQRANTDLESRVDERARELIEAVATLRTERELLRTTLASIGDGVIATDIEGHVTFLNAVAETMTMWPTAEAKDMPLEQVFRIINEDTRQSVENPAMRALKAGAVVGLANHTILIARDGTERWIADSAAPIRDEAGAVNGAVLVFRDVTEKRLQDQELAAREQQFRTLAESIPQLAWMADPNGDLFWYNQRWYDYTGTTFEQMDGWGWQIVHDPKELPRVLEEWKKCIAIGKPLDMVFPLKGKDGLFRQFLTRVEPVKDEDGRVVRWFGTNTDITERQRIEEELREARARLEATLTAAEIGTCVFDLVTNTIRADDNFARMYGIPPEEAAGGPVDVYKSRVHPDDWDRLADAVIQAVETGEPYGCEHRIVAADGVIRWVAARGTVERDDSGEALSVPGVIVDITERKRVEDELREERERLAFALEAADLGQWELNLVDRSTSRTMRHDQIFGYDSLQPAWTFESFLDHVVPGDRRSVETSFLETESTGTGLDLECRITRADGAERWIWTKARIKHDSLGRPERMLGIVGDHTGRKQIVEAERTGRERLRMALTAARMVAWQFDPSTGAVVMSDNITDVFGLPVGTSDIAQALAILHPDDVDQHHTLIDQAARRNEGFVSEFRIFRPDTGAMQWMEERGHSVRETPGGPTRLVGVVMDITGRKRAEDELRRLAAELSEADRRKDEFLATLAHELRNPLAPIRNGLELMKLVGGEAPIVAEARTMMDRQLTQMVRLVDDLMDVSRISGGKIELRKERVSLATVVHSAVETSRPQIEKMGHKLTINLPAQPIFMDADLTRLAQVFLNLLNNAAKYSDRGGDIRLTAHQQGRDVVVSVVDNGIGIAVDQLQRIFDMFIQVDRSLEKSHGGLGIGLTLVKRLVELHGGFVEAKSDGPGMGSEFVVRLPVVADASLSQSLHPGDSSGAKTSLRILIVDDNRDGADSLSAMLRLMGNDTLTAYDGRQGIEAARKFRPDVILLDIGLPLVNGYEVCRRIREQPWCQDTVFIAVTGWGQEQDRRRSQEAGFDRHMIKPVDPAALMKLLSTHQSMKT